MLVGLLNAVEQGTGRWPTATLQARTVFLHKEGPVDDPLNFRVLTALPLLYRRWASCRLRQLIPWIRRWQLDEMVGGLPGSGAEDAWYGEALQHEFAFGHRGCRDLCEH